MSILKLKTDLSFGEGKEDVIIKQLEAKGWIIDRGNKTSIIDFYARKKNEDGRKKDKVYYIELKTRRNWKADYNDTMIGANKMAEAWNKFYKEWIETIFLFSFTDGDYYYNPIKEHRTEYRAGRWDRGSIDQKKGWLFINNNFLKKWEN